MSSHRTRIDKINRTLDGAVDQDHLAIQWHDGHVNTFQNAITLLDHSYTNSILDLSDADWMAAALNVDGHSVKFSNDEQLQDVFFIASDGTDSYFWRATNADDDATVSADELTLYSTFEDIDDLTDMYVPDIGYAPIDIILF